MGSPVGRASIWDGAKRQQTSVGFTREEPDANLPLPITVLWLKLPKWSSDLFKEMSWAPPAKTCLQ